MGLVTFFLGTLFVCPSPSGLWVHPTLPCHPASLTLLDWLCWLFTHGHGIPASHKGLASWISSTAWSSSQSCWTAFFPIDTKCRTPLGILLLNCVGFLPGKIRAGSWGTCPPDPGAGALLWFSPGAFSNTPGSTAHLDLTEWVPPTPLKLFSSVLGSAACSDPAGWVLPCSLFPVSWGSMDHPDPSGWVSRWHHNSHGSLARAASHPLLQIVLFLCIRQVDMIYEESKCVKFI